MKVVVNRKYGGFGLSPQALEAIAKRKGESPLYFYDLSLRKTWGTLDKMPAELGNICWTAYTVPNPEDYRLDELGADGTLMEANARAEGIKPTIDSDTEKRTDPDLVAVVEELGNAANGAYAKLEVVEIPDDIEWEIEEYGGVEYVVEAHRTW